MHFVGEEGLDTGENFGGDGEGSCVVVLPRAMSVYEECFSE